MKKSNIWVRRMALAMAMSFLMVSSALAAQTVTTGSGTSRLDPQIITTHEQSWDGNGRTTNTQTVQTTWAETDPQTGLGTEYISITETKTTIDAGGNVLSKAQSDWGEEKTVSDQTPPDSVVLRAGEQTTATTAVQNSMSTDPAGALLQTTILQQRTVTANTGTIQTLIPETDADSLTSNLLPIQPVWTGQEKDVENERPDRFAIDLAARPAGYDFCYSGWGQDSYYGAYHKARLETSDAAGQPIVQETSKEGDVMQFLLTDTRDLDQNLHRAYCADLSTRVQNGSWYRLDNLASAGYYLSQEDQNHIRAIAYNGYWGTAQGEMGSLSALQALLTNAQTNGNAQTKALLAGQDFSMLTAGEAQAATQMAIWQYGHLYDERAELTLTASNYNGSAGWTSDAQDELAWARINAAASYLVTLSESAETASQIITQDAFIESATLTVRDKAGAEYLADLTFTLYATPRQEDDLCLQIFQNGSLVGTKKLTAGERAYTMTDLWLAEGEKVSVELTLTGTQYVEKGVYIYTSYTAAQTMVGLAQGHRSVSLALQMDFDFSVEDARVLQQRTWRRSENSDWNVFVPVVPQYSQLPMPTLQPVPEANPEEDLSAVVFPATGQKMQLWLAAFLLVLAALAVWLPVSAKKRDRINY